MLVKIHKTVDGKIVVAVCDTVLFGKKFVEGNRQLDLTNDFYKGDELEEDEIGDLIRNAYSINLVGEQSVALGIKEGVIEEENIIRVQGIPHAESVNVIE